jgi:hypothetical protein
VALVTKSGTNGNKTGVSGSVTMNTDHYSIQAKFNSNPNNFRLSVTNHRVKMVSSGTLRSVALVRTDVSEELSASFIRVTRIGN